MRINCTCNKSNLFYSLVLNVKRKSYFALQDLRKTGLENQEAVHIFKEKINELIKFLKNNDDPYGKDKTIQKGIDEENRLINTIDLLIKYRSHPTEIIAQNLRRIAVLDVNSKEFIQEQMDKQKNPKFRFNLPKIDS